MTISDVTAAAGSRAPAVARTAQAQQVADIAARLERLPLTSYQRWIFGIIATAWFFDSMDLAALTFVLGSIRQTFGLSTAEAGLLSSMSFLGMFVGAASAGLLADRFGRARVFQVSMIFWGLGSLCCGLSTTATALGASRLLLGFGMGMEFPVAQSMVSEIMPARNRGRYIAFLEGFWPLGFIASGLLTYFVLQVADWRWVFILQAIPAVFVLVVRRFVPESPRWLASHGYSERAEATVRDIESRVRDRLGGKDLPPVVRQAAAPTSEVTGLRTLFSGIYAKRTTMLWTLWFFALLGFYGLTTWLGALLQAKGFPITKSVFYTILISLAGIPGFLVSAWLVESWGRKATLVMNLLCGAIACHFYGSAADQTQLIIAGLCMQFFLFGMWSALYAYTPELYPTHVRATGTGFASAVGRIGSLIGPYVIGVILPAAGQGGVFALGAGAFVVAALAVLLLGEETRGRTLESISH
ncbi:MULTISPECIES: MFS transporter [Bradyrhizobium]|jgi:MFS transporter, putative metabolite:H+ symporter|uniref:MFS transporter n=1 Tax=Bradyrhizobium TaxID=374 RepID=UPI00047F1D4F|nr:MULTISPECIES: MFS transporter [Bradyrhizobium]MCS3448197.1 putative MFS transporter [Bradyrhizobium elkanii]MCS3560664.1 putative MFS transporter [Bradyrhizobium elkanii]MCW2149493.1 putative MFS transporter [Bradyrhizobium elkanii]MCW2360539.1 putative MFS transporter [Bradyrhizobium elkanii]MCW2373222.1 putative MFS transporter [Bradyrhizobium elkanii]